MNLSVRSTGTWQHTLDIEVPGWEEVERRLEEVARQLQRRASLPGFRKGRVPLDMVRQHYAEAVEQEFLESFVPRLTGEAIEQSKLAPIVTPVVRNLRFTPGQPLRFEAVIEVRPEVEAKDYLGIPVRRHAHAVDDAAVDAVLGQLREDSAVFTDLDRAAERGDVVLLDSVRLDANGRRMGGTRAKNRRIELGPRAWRPSSRAACWAPRRGRSGPSRSTIPTTTRPRSWPARARATWPASGKSSRRSCGNWTITSPVRSSGSSRSRSFVRACA
jgi:FKBP-type peptidyl-prolyl cis-trans isomerase (trigger factor)